jgi:hypothetical protein
MTHIIEIGNTKYTVNIEKDSGRVELMLEDELYWVGQWFPFQQCLSLPKFPSEDIRLKLQDELKQKLSSEDITFKNL